MARIGYARVSSLDQDLDGIKERQKEGIERAKANGIYRGGSRRFDRGDVFRRSRDGQSPAAIAEAVGCSRMTVYRLLKADVEA